MGNSSHDPVDHVRTTRPHAGEAMKDTAQMPGLILIGAGVVAIVIALVNFALGQVGIGIAAVVVALLAAGAGSAWLGMERRRVHQAERQSVTNHRGAAR